MQLEGTLQGIAVREASRAPMKEQQQVDVTVKEGMLGDYRGTGWRQITCLDVAQWQQTISALGIDLPWHTRRANLLIAGLDLQKLIGCHLLIGECRFALRGETTPCRRMDELQPGLRAVLIPEMRGGVWGKVVHGGQLCVGQGVRVLP